MSWIPPVLVTYCGGLKSHDVDRIASTVADDMVFVLPDKELNKDLFLTMLRALYRAFPDWHYESEPIEVHDELFAIRWLQSGTHTGDFTLPEKPPIVSTGKKVQIPRQYFFYRVRGSRIVEIRPDPVA